MIGSDLWAPCIWNNTGLILDRIDWPKDLLSITRALNTPKSLCTTQILRTMRSSLARELGLDPEATLVPRGWLDNTPCIGKSLEHENFPSYEYGLLDPLPILIYHKLNVVLIRSGAKFYLWPLRRHSHVHRIIQTNDIKGVLEALGQAEKLGQTLDLEDYVIHWDMLHRYRGALSTVCLEEKIPDDEVPKGWLNVSNEKPWSWTRFMWGRSEAQVLLQNPEDSTYLLRTTAYNSKADPGSRYYLWKRGSDTVKEILQPHGLLNVLNCLNYPELLELLQNQSSAGLDFPNN